MSDFITLCGDVSRRSGAVGAAPTTVIGQVNRQGKVVDWVASAWGLIQRLQTDWSFLKGEWSGLLVIDQMTYTAAGLGIATRFAAWLGDRGRYHPTTIYDTTIGQANESELHEITYEQWRERYDRGVHVHNRPIHYALAPDQTLRVGPKPDKAYRVRGEYRKAPQMLAADADIPDMPAQFHDVITYRAMMLLAEHDEARDALTVATANYTEVLHQMEIELLPQFTIGGRR